MSETQQYKPKVWMDGGIVAERTNLLINRLIAEMNGQDAYTVSTKSLNTFIRKVVGVDGDDTLREYRERIVKHGPFFVGFNGYVLTEEYRGVMG